MSDEIPQAAAVGETGDLAAEEVLLRHVADDTARDAQAYLATVTEVAAGDDADRAIALLLLSLSQTLLAGARLGALTDVVPSERYEPDTGPDPDVDPVRSGLANLFEGLDEYGDVADPLTDPSLVRGSLVNDLADVAAELSHGMRHYRAGQVDEALWWWQYSYLSSWGERATSALRVLQSLLRHLRLDADPETVADAEFEALHAEDALDAEG